MGQTSTLSADLNGNTSKKNGQGSPLQHMPNMVYLCICARQIKTIHEARPNPI